MIEVGDTVRCIVRSNWSDYDAVCPVGETRVVTYVDSVGVRLEGSDSVLTKNRFEKVQAEGPW